MQKFLLKLSEGASLSKDEMKTAAGEMFKEHTTESEIAALLMALKLKGETVDEITGLVEALLDKAVRFQKKIPGLIDNCGTGGDGSKSFNISTTSAFVLAGAGLKVAKHGNRSITSRSGSADVLENLGVSLNMSSAEVEDTIEQIGIAFLFAPHVHPMMKKIMNVRRSLNIPTIFNLIGPLTNPLPLETQVIGVYRKDLLTVFAEVLRNLGRKRAVLLHGAGGLDEATLAGENYYVLLESGRITEHSFTPEDVGLKRVGKEEIVGGDANLNAKILRDVLKGKEGPHLDTVLLNAGIGLFTSGMVMTIQEGIHEARKSIFSGKAFDILEQLISISSKREVI
ncbi:anthranilate phosphoribosyltransferase [Bacillus oleivorans]|uniref:Anthranilate phosphoribosyltransferase n=1 Tax=Bacillus oleivorans TaxID=1448271 RepID=A0A285CLI9_9BACI|nr:anthranilate phosphoribosyltransferase [Bacillus oleivorans]SNX68411.1 anthranilate phosphoribosyltransferase [Bacillus oleivorans]